MRAKLNPPQRLLYGPGPSMVEPRVYDAMSKPIVGHLDPYFFQINQEIKAGLQAAYGTANEFTLAMSATGSGGMETAVANFVEPGSKFLVFAAGFFADRLSEMGRRQGANVVRFEKPWGESFPADEAQEVIRREKPNTVAYVAAETSTGVWTDGKAICDAAHEVGALVIADCVTALGSMPIEVDKTGIDIAYSCTQKGLGCPPGLSPVTVSPRAIEWVTKERKSQTPTWYFDLKLLADYFGEQKRYHHTAPITSFYALHEGLSIIAEEGLEKRFARHRANRNAFVAAMDAMGINMQVKPGFRLWNLMTPQVPEGVTDAAVRKHLMDHYGIEIAGGFGQLVGKVFRIGIMGVLATEKDTLFLVEKFQEALEASGFSSKGNGKAAAEASYAQSLAAV
jgi:alanine-glyoxylate transaminase/serine-glyoxylate transaminase/serine-pyruvate transaminase